MCGLVNHNYQMKSSMCLELSLLHTLFQKDNHLYDQLYFENHPRRNDNKSHPH